MSTRATASGYGLNNRQREALVGHPERCRALARLVDAAPEYAPTGQFSVRHPACSFDHHDLVFLRERDVLDRVGQTRAPRPHQTGTKPFVTYAIPEQVADAVQAIVTHLDEREGWCVAGCGRRSIVHGEDGPRCKCGAALREEVRGR